MKPKPKPKRGRFRLSWGGGCMLVISKMVISFVLMIRMAWKWVFMQEGTRKVSQNTHTHIHTRIKTHLHTHIYTHRHANLRVHTKKKHCHANATQDTRINTHVH